MVLQNGFFLSEPAWSLAKVDISIKKLGNWRLIHILRLKEWRKIPHAKRGLSLSYGVYLLVRTNLDDKPLPPSLKALLYAS